MPQLVAEPGGRRAATTRTADDGTVAARCPAAPGLRGGHADAVGAARVAHARPSTPLRATPSCCPAVPPPIDVSVTDANGRRRRRRRVRRGRGRRSGARPVRLHARRPAERVLRTGLRLAAPRSTAASRSACSTRRSSPVGDDGRQRQWRRRRGDCHHGGLRRGWLARGHRRAVRRAARRRRRRCRPGCGAGHHRPRRRALQLRRARAVRAVGGHRRRTVPRASTSRCPTTSPATG